MQEVLHAVNWKNLACLSEALNFDWPMARLCLLQCKKKHTHECYKLNKWKTLRARDLLGGAGGFGDFWKLNPTYTLPDTSARIVRKIVGLVGIECGREKLFCGQWDFLSWVWRNTLENSVWRKVYSRKILSTSCCEYRHETNVQQGVWEFWCLVYDTIHKIFNRELSKPSRSSVFAVFFSGHFISGV